MQGLSQNIVWINLCESSEESEQDEEFSALKAQIDQYCEEFDLYEPTPGINYMSFDIEHYEQMKSGEITGDPSKWDDLRTNASQLFDIINK